MKRRTRTSRRFRASRDRGLTLTELLVSVVILGLVATGVAGAIVAFIRVQSSVTEQVSETRDLQRLVDYLSADVASARQVFTDEAKMLTPCGAGDEAIIDLEWYEQFGGIEYSSRVTYWQNGGNGGELVRYQCATASAPTRLVVAKAYDSLAVTQPLSSTSGAVLGTVELDFQQSTGTRRIVLSSRNYIPEDQGGG